MFFDLSIWKIAVLGVIALVVFGPERLPKMAAQAGQALRDVRRLAENARADLTEHLPEEYRNLDLNDLNPKAFVRKHLWEDTDLGSPVNIGGSGPAGIGSPAPATDVEQVPGTYLEPGESPPWDIDAT